MKRLEQDLIMFIGFFCSGIVFYIFGYLFLSVFFIWYSSNIMLYPLFYPAQAGEEMKTLNTKKRNVEIIDYYLTHTKNVGINFDNDIIEEMTGIYFLSPERIKSIITCGTIVVSVRFRKEEEIKITD